MGLAQIVMQTVHFTLEFLDLLGQRIERFGLAPPALGKPCQRPCAPGLAPRGQVRGIQTFAPEEPAHFTRRFARIGLLENAELVLGLESPTLRLLGRLRVGYSGCGGLRGGALVATLLVSLP